MQLKTFAIGLFGALAWAASAAADPAVMFKGDSALTGGVNAPSPAALKGVRFTFHADGPIRGTPALAGGALYFGSADGNFYAIDAATGAERWRIHSGIVNSSAAVVDGSVYFTTRDHMLRTVSAADGAPQWSFDLGKDLGPQNYWDFYTSSPTPFGPNLYVGSGDGHVYAIDRATGHEVWRFEAGARVRSTPAISGDAVVFATMAGKVYAVDRNTGAKRWMFATQGATNTFALKDNDSTSIFSSPSISDGVVVVGCRDAFLYGIDLTTGKQKWRITHDGDSWILSTAAQNGRVYSGSGSANFMQSANLQTGAENWRAPTAGAIFGSLTIASDVVLFDDFAGNVYAVDKNTGKELWRFALDARSLSTPTVGADGTVYVTSDNGILYALETSPTPASTPAKKYVYWQGKKSKDDFSFFQNGIDAAILNYFKSVGYEQIDEAALNKIVSGQQGERGHSVIVFADDRTPPILSGAGDDHAPIRQYLDVGGRAVFLGTNPLSFKYDPKTGELVAFDFAVAEKILGIHFPPRNIDSGYNVSAPTDDGRRWGLQTITVTNGTLEPREASVVLTADEFGKASSWVKTYPNGGALLQLQIPRGTLGDLSQYRIAIEHGL